MTGASLRGRLCGVQARAHPRRVARARKWVGQPRQQASPQRDASVLKLEYGDSCITADLLGPLICTLKTSELYGT